MKNTLSFISLLAFAILCCGCVNSFAIQELNQMANEYIQKGDYENAISRLESCIDLDGNNYETRYNLAVSYIHTNQCKKALNQANEAIRLANNDNVSDAYYTKGVAYDCMADDLYKESDENDNQNQGYKKYLEDLQNGLTEADKASRFVEYLKDANEAYQKYIDTTKDKTDIDNVKEQIANNLDKINETTSKYGI